MEQIKKMLTIDKFDLKIALSLVLFGGGQYHWYAQLLINISLNLNLIHIMATV